MKHVECLSPILFNSHLRLPNGSALAATPSDSTTSAWCGSSSQESDISSCFTKASGPGSCASTDSVGATGFCDAADFCHSFSRRATQCREAVPLALRQNTRRTSTSATSRSGRPPQLIRQAERKINFVENLVDSSTLIIEAIWPTSTVVCRTEHGGTGVLPLRTFIEETLRRSRTSYSTLQVALYYLILMKPHVPDHDFTMEQPNDCHASRAIQCGRRMFLAALILASKYLQDRNYSARAWSKISGLDTQEINRNEIVVLLALDWKLHITDKLYNSWTEFVMRFTPAQPPPPGAPGAQSQYDRQCKEFKNVVLNMDPELDVLEKLTQGSPKNLEFSGNAVVSPRSSFISPNEHIPSPSACADRRVCSSNRRSLHFDYPQRQRSTFQDSTVEFPVVHGKLVVSEPRSMSPKCPSPSPVKGSRSAAGEYGDLPLVIEPEPTWSYLSVCMAPALGLLPTPRSTPRPSGYNAPAVSATARTSGQGSSTRSSVSRTSNIVDLQTPDRWPGPVTSSPQNYVTRRLSLVTPTSTGSSPESMVSDSSSTSRSSSISSISSYASAPSSTSDVQARRRYGKHTGEGFIMKMTISPVLEMHEHFIPSSPMQGYPAVTTLACEDADIDMAARTLQDLQNYRVTKTPRKPCSDSSGLKRRRFSSPKSELHDNVRELLLVHRHLDHGDPAQHVLPVSKLTGRFCKRVRCVSERIMST